MSERRHPSLVDLYHAGPREPKRAAVGPRERERVLVERERRQPSDHPVRALPPELKAWLVSTLANGNVAPKDMCNFVTRFCRTAGYPCDDDIYKAAMGVFGWTPKAGSTPGEALPGRASAFPTWQSLFIKLCDAYRTRPVGLQGQLWLTLSRMPRSVPGHDELAVDLDEMVMARAGAETLVSGMKQLMRADDTPQRFLDQFLIMLYKWIENNHNNLYHPRSPLLGLSAYRTAGMLTRWEGGAPGDKNTFVVERSDAVAMFLVLWMRGARLRGNEHYVATVDKPMYQTLIDGLQGKLEWPAVYALAKQFVKDGGDANYIPGNRPGDGATQLAQFGAAAFRTKAWLEQHTTPTLFELALASRQTGLILLLLEEGKASIAAGEGEYSEFGHVVMDVLARGALDGGERLRQQEVLHLIGSEILRNVQEPSWEVQVELHQSGKSPVEHTSERVKAFLRLLEAKDHPDEGDKLVLEAFGRLLDALKAVPMGGSGSSSAHLLPTDAAWWANPEGRPSTPRPDSDSDSDTEG